jgi:PAS domain S-box-containing protein
MDYRPVPHGHWRIALEDAEPYPEAPASPLEIDGHAQFHLAAIIESADDAIISKDLQGVVTSWNQAACRIFGYTAEDMIGRSIRLLIPETLQYEEEDILTKLRAGQRIDHYETTRIRKDGKMLDVSVTISPINDGKGRVIGASKIVRDISDRKRIEQVLIQSEKLAVTGRMAATIAHEINNPLESVMNLIFLARQAVPPGDKAHQYLLTAESELNRVAQIAQQTLGYYRGPSTPVTVDLHELIETVLTVYHSKLCASKISIERQFGDLQKIVAIKGELVQVLSNLIANAVDAMTDGGALHLSTRMASTAFGDGIELIIRDEGAGIDPKHLDKIYDPFFTTKGERGTGIGLWVSRQLVEKRGGRITIASSTDAADSGTSATIFLPVADPGTLPSGTSEAKIAI